jgi:hypothetical protein
MVSGRRAPSLTEHYLADTERYASHAVVFYASFLGESVGSSFAFPSLDVLADYWFDKSSEPTRFFERRARG